jgi:N-acetylmuramoyl-L-alanine amidase CwlD
LKSTSRFAARIGSTLATAICAVAFAGLPAKGAAPPYVFAGRHLSFPTLFRRNGIGAVAVDDPGVAELLQELGATLTWQGGERRALVTTAEPAVTTFSVGRRRYDVGPLEETANLAPFLLDGRMYVSFDALLRGLDFAAKPYEGTVVLQPQLASIDLESLDGGEKLIARGGMPLNAALLSDGNGEVAIAFDGVGSLLPPSERGNGPVRTIEVRTAGTAADPRTIVTLHLAPGATHTALGTDDQRDVAMGFDGAPAGQPLIAEGAAPASPQQSPQPQPSPSPPAADASPAISPTPGLASVTGVLAQAQDSGYTVRIAVDGNAQYEWHRLRPPDNRFWIDIDGARLNVPPLDEAASGPVTGVRSHQEDPVTVRVALSLAGFQTVTVTPDAQGVTIRVDQTTADVNAAPRSGEGGIGRQAVAQNGPEPVDWSKFAPRPKGTSAANPRLIVIDPGHGGSDAGSVHGGLVEKTINLQIAKRLRDILVARGWQVIMTRTSDRDVYGPDATDDEELGARDEIANRSGARLFVSIHGNAFMNAGPHGATVYYYKASDVALAQDIARNIAVEGIASDGVVKDKLYVVHHADMPAALVETAYLTNPDDRRLLVSPEWQQKIATAIADGITQYAGDPPPPSQNEDP